MEASASQKLLDIGQCACLIDICWICLAHGEEKKLTNPNLLQLQTGLCFGFFLELFTRHSLNGHYWPQMFELKDLKKFKRYQSCGWVLKKTACILTLIKNVSPCAPKILLEIHPCSLSLLAVNYTFLQVYLLHYNSKAPDSQSSQ